ncbi:MAG: hypothetical protein DHS20C18_00750 [Saprospiraceae bacterium]|nr:MAG: hypothetical protein DHS20C18_00750 [Saprospiraceae bacterium]
MLLLLLAPVVAQTIVSTTVENRNAVLEEYGGIYCIYCPEGNAIASVICSNHPNDVVLINIHEGPYANPLTGAPDYRTDFGESLASQTGLNGYPAGTINRRVFAGYEQGQPNTTALNRSYWDWAVESILEETSPVNLAATASLDLTTEEMTIYVEIYYTGNSTTDINKLNIALLQNEIVGPQLGGGMGNEYVHNHMLRDMITGQWGTNVSPTTTGHFEARTITYSLPSEVRGIPIDPSKLELGIFISEGRQRILTGIRIQPTYVVPYAHDGNAILAATDAVVCGELLNPSVIIRNDGYEPLTSIQVQYQVNGGPTEVYNWTGNLYTFESETITLPSIYFEPDQNGVNVLDVVLASPNDNPDEGAFNNHVSFEFSSAPQTNSQLIEVNLRTDDYGYESYWEITDEAGDIIASGGNLSVGATTGGQQISHPDNPGAYGNNQNITEWITLPAEGCYYFRMLDDYGDGICCDYGIGFYKLKDAGGQSLFTGGIFSGEKIEPFQFGFQSTVANEEVNFIEAISVYPNPLHRGEDLHLQLTTNQLETMTFQLFSLEGKLVASMGTQELHQGVQTLSFPLPELTSGVYLLQLQTKGGRQVVKVMVLD